MTCRPSRLRRVSGSEGSEKRILGKRTWASWTEVMAFIEREKLYGLGYGFVDIALLASACITPDARLWTPDKKLQDLARRFGVEFALPLH